MSINNKWDLKSLEESKNKEQATTEVGRDAIYELGPGQVVKLQEAGSPVEGC